MIDKGGKAPAVQVAERREQVLPSVHLRYKPAGGELNMSKVEIPGNATCSGRRLEHLVRRPLIEVLELQDPYLLDSPRAGAMRKTLLVVCVINIIGERR